MISFSASFKLSSTSAEFFLKLIFRASFIVLKEFKDSLEVARKNEDFETYMSYFRDDAKIFKRLHPGSNSGSFLPKQQYAKSPGEEFGIQVARLCGYSIQMKKAISCEFP